MVALSSETPDSTSQTKGLRWKIGAGVAAAWLLAQLWIASPFPYMLGDAAGISLVINSTQSRGLHLGFALCLAFILFPSRWLRVPWAVDAVLAIVAAISGSAIAWNYGHLALNPVNPGSFSLAVAFVGVVMLALAALRVFGWLGVVFLTLVILAHLSPAFQGLPAPAKLQGLQSLLNLHWFTTESVFGILLGVSVSFAFLIVVLGIALDVMGQGRPLVRLAFRPLPRDIDKEGLADSHPFARRLWGLTLLLIAVSVINVVGMERLGLLEALALVVWPAFYCLMIYGVSLVFAWAANRISNRRWRDRCLFIAVGGMLFGLAQLLALLLAVFLEDVSGGLVPALGSAGIWLLVFALVSLPMAFLAWSTSRPSLQRRWLAVLAALPVLLYFWEMSVERFSPGLSAFYAVILMLIVSVEHYIVTRRNQDTTPMPTLGHIAAVYFIPLCHGTARVMLRVMILAALYGMTIPWALFWAPFFLE